MVQCNLIIPMEIEDFVHRQKREIIANIGQVVMCLLWRKEFYNVLEEKSVDAIRESFIDISRWWCYWDVNVEELFVERVYIVNLLIERILLMD